MKISEDVLSQHIAVVGKTGSGKTSTEKLMVEQVVAEDYRVCILDTVKSDWWGITSSADGKHPGLPFKILGGPHGHVPLHSSAGAVIGKLVGDGQLPLSIIDMADFEAGGLQRFFCDFAPALMRNMKGVLYLVLEEAHELAPKERSGFGAENMAIHWAKKLATAGRSKGIRMIVATQRVQSLHNAVLGSCETLIAHRLTTPADQDPIVKWLKANTDKETAEKVSKSLSSLPRGTGWMCSGEAKIFKQVAFPKFKTYDNAATPTKDGTQQQVKTAPVDQEKLRAVIGDAVKDAEANDPKRLRAKIAELQKAQAHQTKGMYGGWEVEQARQDGIKQGHDAGWNGAFIAIKPKIQVLMKTLDEAFKEIERIGAGRPAAPKMPQVATPKPQVGAAQHHINVRKSQVATSSLGISAPQKRILDSLATLETLGVRAIQKNQIAAVAGVSPRSSGYTNNLSALRTAGMIDYPRPGEVSLTEAGKGAATYPDEKPTIKELQQSFLRIVPNPQARILSALIDQYPEPAPKALLAEQVGVSAASSGYTNNLSALRSLGFIDYPASGMVVATDILFPEAA